MLPDNHLQAVGPEWSRSEKLGTARPDLVSATALIEIANYAALRREIGIEGCDALLEVLMTAQNADFGRLTWERFGRGVVLVACDEIDAEYAHAAFTTILHGRSVLPALDGQLVNLDLVAGVALQAPGEGPVSVLERAEHALSIARGAEAVVISGGARTAEDEGAKLLLGLPGAASRNEFFVAYQPKVHVKKRVVSSAEALIRWQHPVYGLVMPDEFIGLADESGEIRAITLWTLRRVIADQRALAQDGNALRIFVNVSGGLLTDRGFIDEACDIVRAGDARIGFEITETSVIRDPDLAIENLERCTSVGIALAIDDYGSGLSSLSYLKRLPASELKIDKMFVTQLTSSHRDPLIVRSTIDLAHALDMEVTAEGVETPAALALLSVMGCEMVQGYLISPPLRFAEFKSYLSEYRFDALQLHNKPSVVRPESFWKRA